MISGEFDRLDRARSVERGEGCLEGRWKKYVSWREMRPCHEECQTHGNREREWFRFFFFFFASTYIEFLLDEERGTIVSFLTELEIETILMFYIFLGKRRNNAPMQGERFASNFFA